MLEIQDQIGRILKLERKPRRIISLVPSLTELAAEFAGEDSIIGLTTWCVHPKGLKESKTIIGGTKNVNVELVRQLQPDLILANKEENIEEQIEILAKDFPVYVSDVRDLKSARGLIKEMGNLLQADEKAHVYLHQATEALSKMDKSEGSFLIFIWNKPFMVAGPDSYISALLEAKGFKNAAPNGSRYPELSWEEVQRLKPKYIFLSSEPYPFKSADTIEFHKARFTCKILDGEMLTWYSHRLAKSLNYINRL